MRAYGAQSMVAPLRRVIVRRPDESFAVDDPAAWHYAARPDLAAAQAEHDAFVAVLRDFGAEVIYADAPQPGRADAIFVHDPAIVADAGAVLLRLGKPLREGEEQALGAALEHAGVAFVQELERRGVALVEVPEAEFLSMGTNVLALAPGELLMLAGNPVTQARLAAAGCEVRTYAGREISLKAEGGATCLTRPLLRGEG
jgi:N-dimethylarginine dimethylaminohydrolase